MDRDPEDSDLREGLLWLVRRRRRFRVTGPSMRPVLEPGAHVLVDPRAYRTDPPVVGDVVVARHPFKKDVRVVKRVAAVLPDGRVALRGDNRAESTDSTTFGTVAPDRLLGRVTSRLA